MLTMPTSESSEMDSTNMVTPTVTAFPKISCNCILGNEAAEAEALISGGKGVRNELQLYCLQNCRASL